MDLLISLSGAGQDLTAEEIRAFAWLRVPGVPSTNEKWFMVGSDACSTRKGGGVMNRRQGTKFVYFKYR